MSEMTQAELETLIRQIDDLVSTITAGAATDLVNYQIGPYRFDKNVRLESLRKLRETYTKQLKEMPTELHTIVDDPDVVGYGTVE